MALQDNVVKFVMPLIFYSNLDFSLNTLHHRFFTIIMVDTISDNN